MKLGILSDIHGDAVALELAWAHLTVMGVDRIVSAGDLVGYGPHPNRVVEFVAEHKINSVRGNHDRWAIDRPLGAPDPFRGGTPSPATIEALRALPADLLIQDGAKIGLVTHGAPGDDMMYVTRKLFPPVYLRHLLATMGVELMIVGHSHQPFWYRWADGIVINPGSVVSAPVVSTSRTFAVLDWDEREVTFHDVETGNRVTLDPWVEDENDPDEL